MCDTVVAFGSDGLWLGKNSDREPGEPQLVAHHARRRAAGARARVRCTHVEIDDVGETYEVVLSRPFWMWGAEMGVNEKGVAIGNEAVFTTERLDSTGLTGMDLLRLALERASCAREAVHVITGLLAAYGQGGRMGHRKPTFSYSSSFLIADGVEAWVLETAGRRWAAERVIGGVRAISNALTIGVPDLLDEESRSLVAIKGKGSFARAFDDPLMSALAGASRRRACTLRAGPSFAAMAAALRSHGGHAPSDGLVMSMPCAHASLWPTRSAGQTTASMIAQLPPSSGGPLARVWMTGTSSPCLSVFKPVPMARGALLEERALGPAPGVGFDNASLWWKHERLHRAVLARDDEARASVAAVAALLEEGALASDGACDAPWIEHRALVDEWRSGIERIAARGGGLFRWYWRRESAREGMPA